MTPLDAALAAVDQATWEQPDPAPLIGAKCRALMRGYDARFRNAGYVPVSVEETLTAPLVNVETMMPSRTFRSAGKLDLVTSYQGGLWLFDHKSTSQDISDPAGSYWRQLVVEAQPSHYNLLLWQHGRKVDGTVWDVMRKPGISPRQLTKAEVARIVANREYCGASVSMDAVRTAQQEKPRETLELYEARLYQECTSDSARYFQRRPVPRMDSEILEYAEDIWEHGQDILNTRNRTTRKQKTKPNWLPPPNDGACMLYGSPCKFLGICSHYDRPDSDKWTQKTQVHNELPLLEGDGRDVLTPSRLRCFKTCKRKHYLEYELGIERIDEEEHEALFFGNVWHAGLNAWWMAQISQGC